MSAADCDVCGLPDPYNGGGDGIGSCECPRCDGGEAAASSVLCVCPPDDIDSYPDDEDPGTRQSTTACCPRQTIPDSCSCPDGCECMCRDCDCPADEGDEQDEPEPPRTETDCACLRGGPCPCEADGEGDGYCRCCRDGHHNGSCQP